MLASPRGRVHRADGRYGFDKAGYAEAELKRIAIAGFELARKRTKNLVSADKANVIESYKLWREVIDETAADYPDVTLTHMYADNCAYQIAREPDAFDVFMSDNLIGDFLSDLAAIVAGSLGMLPSASLRGMSGTITPGIYEPVHGSAPDIAGRGIANPYGMILSVAMIFEHSLNAPDTARRIERAVDRALETARTPDLGGTHTTSDVTNTVLESLK